MIDSAPRTISGLNRQIYQRLKLALGLDLRRQMFIAVCDDIGLQQFLATELQVELSHAATPPLGPLEGPLHSPDYPQVVSLEIGTDDPNPASQITAWLTQHPLPKNSAYRITTPAFQLLGIERLTRQPAVVQWQFLQNLQTLDQELLRLDANLLIWLPRPWFHTIQQSAPEFWRRLTGVFEFVEESLPVTPAPKPAPVQVPEPVEAIALQEPEVVELPAESPPQPDIWQILSNDLAKLGEQPLQEPEPASPPPPAPASVPVQPQPQETAVVAVSPSPQSLAQPPRIKALEKPRTVVVTAATTVPQPQDRPVLRSRQRVPAPTPAHPPAPPQSPVAVQTPPAPPKSVIFPAAKSTLLPKLPLMLQVPAPGSGSPGKSPAISLKQPALVGAKQTTTAPTALLSHPPATQSLEARLEGLQPMQTLELIEQLHRQQASPGDLAIAYRHLGNFYRERIEQGETAEATLKGAIQIYEQAVECLEKSHSYPPLYTDLLNDMGNLYWMLSRTPLELDQRLTYLNQGIQHYQTALQRLDRASDSQAYAMIQNNLGAAYGDLARYQDTADNLERSIQAYQAALHYRKPEIDSLKYASTQNNLGTAYWHLAQHRQPAQNLREAIAAYSDALQYYNPQDEPLNYAMIQNNLGTAYWNLAQYEQPGELLTRAIHAYQLALVYRTAESAPAAHAATQNNLGTAYWHLACRHKEANADRQDYLTRAIAAYTIALDTATRLPATALTFDTCATQNNLGLAHYQLGTDQQSELDKSERSTHLAAALKHHLQALQGWQKQPEFYETALTYVVQTIRAFYNECGLQGQNLALSQVPGHLLREILPKL